MKLALARFKVLHELGFKLWIDVVLSTHVDRLFQITVVRSARAGGWGRVGGL